MRIVFMGTPEFAVASLDILVKNGYEIAAVVTAPDKPAGRGMQLNKSAVKIYAEEQGLPVLQPTNLKSADFLEELRRLNADLQIVVAFRMLPESVWNMPPLGTYNVHASLLPDYRGAAPINWAIINGEKETGVSTFKLKHEIDSGDILLQRKTSIGENMNVGELYEILMKMGAELLLESVKLIESGKAQLYKQQFNGEPKHAPKIFKEMCRINWSENATQVHNLVRGLSPYPVAWTELCAGAEEKTSVKIFSTKIAEQHSEGSPGKILSFTANELTIQCGKGSILIEELQAAGKKRLKTSEFLKGVRLNNGHYFS